MTSAVLLSRSICGVVRDDGFDTPQDIQQREVKIGIGSEADLKVVAQGGFSLDDAGAVVEQFEGDGGEENYTLVVMGEDAVKVVRVPGVGPVLGKRVGEGGLDGQRKSFHELLWNDLAWVRPGIRAAGGNGQDRSGLSRGIISRVRPRAISSADAGRALLLRYCREGQN